MRKSQAVQWAAELVVITCDCLVMVGLNSVCLGGTSSSRCFGSLVDILQNNYSVLLYHNLSKDDDKSLHEFAAAINEVCNLLCAHMIRHRCMYDCKPACINMRLCHSAWLGILFAMKHANLLVVSRNVLHVVLHPVMHTAP